MTAFTRIRKEGMTSKGWRKNMRRSTARQERSNSWEDRKLFSTYPACSWEWHMWYSAIGSFMVFEERQ